MEMIAEQILTACAKHDIGVVGAQILLAVAKNGMIRGKDIRKHLAIDCCVYMGAAALCKRALLGRHKEPGESYRYYATAAGMLAVQDILDAQNTPATTPAPDQNQGPLLPL